MLLGVTGSGKTFTMAKVIEQMNRPALVLAHNKTLAAQLFHEFRNPSSRRTRSNILSATTIITSRRRTSRRRDVYIEKESTINDELDKLRMSATRSLFERRDVSHRRFRLLHLRSWARPKPTTACCVMLEKGQIDRARGDAAQVCGHSIRALRGPSARHLSRARRYDRNPSALRGLSRSHRAVGQPDRSHPPDRSADRRNSVARIAISRACRFIRRSHYVLPAEQKERAIQTILEELEWWQAGTRAAREESSRRNACSSARISTSR